MNKRDMKKYEKLLMAERAHLSEGLRKLEKDSLYSPIGGKGDNLTNFAENGTDNFERETALNIATGENDWLSDVDDALKRIVNRSYGTCEGCNDEIGRKRLEAFPSARFCLSCQETLERDGVL